ncbi:MAG: acetyl-CoA carboxylase biotin carboxyl carrier protein subunit, partial [Planctomycetota bacterium]
LRRVDGLGQFAALVDGRAFALSVDEEAEGRLRIGLAGEGYAVSVEDERERASRRADRRSEAAGPRVVRGVIPGIVVALLAKEGEEVEAGSPLLLLEAMKMQNEIPAPCGGRVERFHVRPGETVAAGVPLATLTPAKSGSVR